MDKYHFRIYFVISGSNPRSLNWGKRRLPPLYMDDWQIWKWALRKPRFKPTIEPVHLKQRSVELL